MRALPVLLASALALPACVTDQNMTLNPAHVPVVATSELALALDAGPAGLAPGEAERLAGFLAGVRLGLGDRVATTAQGPARTSVARIVSGYGLLLNPAPPGAAAGESVRVVVSRATASLPGCPDWSGGQRVMSAAAAGPNFGCATQATVAAMLADPRDLLQGRDGSTTVDPRISVKAIQTWRDARNSGAAGLRAESAGGAGANGGGR